MVLLSNKAHYLRALQRYVATHSRISSAGETLYDFHRNTKASSPRSPTLSSTNCLSGGSQGAMPPRLHKKGRRMTTAHPSRVAALVIGTLAILAGCTPTTARPGATPAVAPPSPLAQFPCRRTVEAFVAQADLTPGQLADTRVHREDMAGGDQMAYYVVTTRPQTCTGGELRLVILPDCSIDSWKTTPPCRLPALEPAAN